MANWWENTRRVKHSRGNHRRFLTSLDMSEAKRMDAIRNSEIKRGLIQQKFFRGIFDCGCGVTGCIIVSEYD